MDLTDLNTDDGNYLIGNHLPYGSTVKIVSEFSRKQLVTQFKTALLKKNTLRIPARDGMPAQEYLGPDRDEIDQDEVNRLWWSSWRQQLPFPVGPLLNHGTGKLISLFRLLDTKTRGSFKLALRPWCPSNSLILMIAPRLHDR